MDVNGEVRQKTLSAVQKYVAGREVNCWLFDDAQSTAFNEMLPYWITFSRHYTPPPLNRPVPSTYGTTHPVHHIRLHGRISCRSRRADICTHGDLGHLNTIIIAY